MSIISDDIWDFSEWLNYTKREAKGANQHPAPPEDKNEESEGNAEDE